MEIRPLAGATARTGVRLHAALVGYFALVTLVITLSPFDFTFHTTEVSWLVDAGDVVGNIAMFMPLGFLLAGLTGSAGRPWSLVGAAAAFSLLIEVAQVFLPDRYPSPVDVVTNATGAWAGLAIRQRIETWALWHPRLAGQAWLDVPLVGLLYLLVPQLWLTSVALIDHPWRATSMALLAASGCVVMVDVYRQRRRSGRRRRGVALPLMALVWCGVGALPALATSPMTVVGLAIGVLLVVDGLHQLDRGDDGKRFESETLARFTPLFALYLLTAALWPPFRPLTSWHGALGFSDGLNEVGVIELLGLLEQIGGFTLLGYAAAEWRGRQELSLLDDLPRLVIIAAAGAIGLELLQGILIGPGASLVRALLSTTGAVYGVAVYHLSRAHVRALRATVETEAMPKAA